MTSIVHSAVTSVFSNIINIFYLSIDFYPAYVEHEDKIITKIESWKLFNLKLTLQKMKSLSVD